MRLPLRQPRPYLRDRRGTRSSSATEMRYSSSSAGDVSSSAGDVSSCCSAVGCDTVGCDVFGCGAVGCSVLEHFETQAPHGVGYTPNTTLGYGPEAYTFTLVRWGWAIPCIPCTMVFWGLAKPYLGRYWLSYTLTLGSSSRVHTSKYHIPHVPHTTSIP